MFLTTHYMDEAQALADRVAVIARGAIVAEGTPDELGGRDHAETTISFRPPDGLAASEIPALGGENVFFTVIQPIIFLFIFVSVFGSKTTLVGGHAIKRSTYYVSAITTLAVMSATFFNLTISLSRLREQGILERVRSTPLPPSMFLVGRIGTSITVSALLVVLLLAIGKLCFGVSIPTHTLAAGALTVLLAAASLSCLAFAVTFVPSELGVFDPATTGAGIAWGHLAVIAAWGLAGAAVAIWHFRWTPSGQRGPARPESATARPPPSPGRRTAGRPRGAPAGPP